MINDKDRFILPIPPRRGQRKQLYPGGVSDEITSTPSTIKFFQVGSTLLTKGAPLIPMLNSSSSGTQGPAFTLQLQSPADSTDATLDNTPYYFIYDSGPNDDGTHNAIYPTDGIPFLGAVNYGFFSPVLFAGSQVGIEHGSSLFEIGFQGATVAGVRGGGGMGPELVQMVRSINASGIQGVQGYQGPQGVAGVQGLSGVQGTTGAIGPTGLQGNQGPVGTAGVQGDDGPQGDMGFQGVTGAQGVMGDDGLDGLDGAQGSQGPQGDGLQGPQGIQGPQSGSQGPQGPQGTTAAVAAAVSTINVTGSPPSGSHTVDGVSSGTNLILLIAQTSSTDRGLWLASAGTWTQVSPFNPTFVYVTGGTNNIGTMWFLTAANTYKAVTGVYS